MPIKQNIATIKFIKKKLEKINFKILMLNCYNKENSWSYKQKYLIICDKRPIINFNKN